MKFSKFFGRAPPSQTLPKGIKAPPITLSSFINSQPCGFKEHLKRIWGIDARINQDKIEASVDLSKLYEINGAFIKEGLMIKFVDNKHKTLEDLFLNITEGNKIT